MPIPPQRTRRTRRFIGKTHRTLPPCPPWLKWPSCLVSITRNMTRLIRFLILVCTPISIAVLLAQQPDTARNPLGTNPAAATEGQRLFDATCQSCHGPSGQGDRDRGTPAL